MLDLLPNTRRFINEHGSNGLYGYIVERQNQFNPWSKIKHVNMFFNEHGSNRLYGYQALSNNQFNSCNSPQGACSPKSVLSVLSVFKNRAIAIALRLLVS